MMPATLYDLSAQLGEVFSALEESGGELTPEIEEFLAAIEAELPGRVDSLAKLAREFAARAEARKAEAQRLRDAAAQDSRAAESIKRYLGDCLRLANLRKASGSIFSVRIQKNSAPSVEVEDANLLPPAFQRVTIEADKTTLADCWKRGLALPPGVSVSVGEHVRIS